MIGNSFTSALVLCKNWTLIGLLHGFYTWLVLLNCLWVLVFPLVILKVISVHDGLNVWVSLKVLLYEFVYIFFVNFLYVTVNKHLLLLFQSDLDGFLKLSQDPFVGFMECFEVSSKGKKEEFKWLLVGLMKVWIGEFNKFSWEIIAHCQFYCKMKNIYATLKYLLHRPINDYFKAVD